MNFVSNAFNPTSILAIIVFGWLWDAREKVPQSLASTKAALRLKFVKRLPRPKALRFVGFSFTTLMGLDLT
jgi:hypothetical protein